VPVRVRLRMHLACLLKSGGPEGTWKAQDIVLSKIDSACVLGYLFAWRFRSKMFWEIGLQHQYGRACQQATRQLRPQHPRWRISYIAIYIEAPWHLTSHVFETVFRFLFKRPIEFPFPSHECMNILGVVSTAQS
jgi:hypothetical protein